MKNPNLSEIIKGCFKGKSLVRTLTDLRCSTIQLSGDGLDLGAKSGDSSYLSFFSIAPHTQITGTDLLPKDDEVIQVDLEKSIPIPSESQDFVLAMNVLEHVFHYKTCIQESYRVLKTGGNIIGVVPFLKGYHPDPDDYFRFTASAINRILEDTNFCEIEVESLGFGPFTAGASQLAPFLKIKLSATLLWTVAIIMDRVLNATFPKKLSTRPAMFSLGYFFIARKFPSEHETIS